MTLAADINTFNLHVPKGDSAKEVDTWRAKVQMGQRNTFATRVVTSGAETKDLFNFQTQDDAAYLIKGWTVGRRLSGTGSANDGYVRNFLYGFKNKGGVVSAIQAASAGGSYLSVTDQASAITSMVIDGTVLGFQVAGVSGATWTWVTRFQYVGV